MKAVAEKAEDNINLQIEAQYLPYFRQMFKAELRFVRLTAEPTKQQYEKIAADSEPAMKSALHEYVKQMTGRNRAKLASANPRQTIVDAVTKAVDKHLSPEQAARYQKEVAARTVALKRLAVDNLAAMVDKALFLSKEQRLKLVDILENNWDERWSITQYYTNQGRWFPPMPDAKILPLLTEPQQAVWKGIAKNQVNFGLGGFGGLGNGADLDDDPWPEDGPKQNEVLPAPRETTPDGGGKP